MTLTGIRELFVLVFLHAQTRRAYITPATANPNEAWVREQTKTYLKHAKRNDIPVTMIFTTGTPSSPSQLIVICETLASK